MLRLSWIHDVFDFAAVCRDARVFSEAATSLVSCVKAVASFSSYAFIS